MATPPHNHLSLFNLPDFSQLPNEDRQYKRIDVEHSGRLLGTLAGVIVGDTFVSGYGASFGGMDFVRERETLENVTLAVDDAIGQIRALGVSQVSIRAKPFHYSRNEEYLYFALSRIGFIVSDTNLNFYLDLQHFEDADGYRATLRHAPERQLRIAIEAGLDWREASTDEDWVTAYEVLDENRRRNGAMLSLSLEYVQAMHATFGDRVQMFLLENKGYCIAAVLLYAITPLHAMVMYWGDRGDREYRKNDDGPPVAIMNLVAFRTIEKALKNRFQTLDLGPVSTEGRVNFGNARFKASINALPNFRNTLARDL